LEQELMLRRSALAPVPVRLALLAAAFALASLPQLSLAQGVLVVTGPGMPIRLPRPIPPMPTPPPHS
jgi:hypothetical protein